MFERSVDQRKYNYSGLESYESETDSVEMKEDKKLKKYYSRAIDISEDEKDIRYSKKNKNKNSITERESKGGKSAKKIRHSKQYSVEEIDYCSRSESLDKSKYELNDMPNDHVNGISLVNQSCAISSVYDEDTLRYEGDASNNEKIKDCKNNNYEMLLNGSRESKDTSLQDKLKNRVKEHIRDTLKDRIRNHSKDRIRDHDKSKEKLRNRSKDRYREHRSKEKVKDRERDRDREHGQSKERIRDRYRERDRDYIRNSSKDKIKNKERECERNRDRDRDRSKEKTRNKDRDRDREHHRSKERLRNRDRERRRSRDRMRDRDQDQSIEKVNGIPQDLSYHKSIPTSKEFSSNRCRGLSEDKFNDISHDKLLSMFSDEPKYQIYDQSIIPSDKLVINNNDNSLREVDSRVCLITKEDGTTIEKDLNSEQNNPTNIFKDQSTENVINDNHSTLDQFNTISNINEQTYSEPSVSGVDARIHHSSHDDCNEHSEVDENIYNNISTNKADSVNHFEDKLQDKSESRKFNINNEKLKEVSTQQTTHRSTDYPEYRSKHRYKISNSYRSKEDQRKRSRKSPSSRSKELSRRRSRYYSPRVSRDKSYKSDSCNSDVKLETQTKKESPPKSSLKTKSKSSKWDVLVVTDLDPCFTGFSYNNGMMLPNLQPPLEDRRGRRLYVGNLPPGVTEAAVVQFFNGALLAASGIDYSVAAASGQFPALKAESYLPDHRYCFVEFRTIADTSIGLKLDGISFNGYPLKIGRPNDYTSVPRAQELSTPEALASLVANSSLANFVPETKMYATELPITFTDDDLRKLVEPFGTIRSLALMKDLKTGQSMGCGVVEFEDAASTSAAVKALDRKPLANKLPRFTKGPPITGTTKILDPCTHITHTSSNVTELPTSMTYKIFSNAIVGAQVKAARVEGCIPSKVVQLLNAVFPEDLINDDEYNSILEDIKEEASQYGTILNVVIPRPNPDLSLKPGVGKVFLHFSDTTAARKAQAELNGRRYEQRRIVCAAFYSLDRFLREEYTLV